MDLSTITFREVAIAFGICASISLVGAIGLFIVAARQVANIEIPEGADFFETLQHLPITVPLALDLLDMAFDVFAAPIAWVILELMGLQALQMVTIFEGLIPGTQLLPTMSASWVIARIMKQRQPQSTVRDAMYRHQIEMRTSRRSASLADEYRRKSLPMPGEGYQDNVIDGELSDFDDDEDYMVILDDEEPW